jgi:RimJ/RimL family protein N-acetyltransferase
MACVLLLDGKRIAGMCDINRDPLQGREHNVSFGLSVASEYRRKGIGEMLLRKAIEVAKEQFRPHRMWIEYVDGNKTAARLYKKVGFREFARQDEYVCHYGAWHDCVLMQYKGK